VANHPITVTAVACSADDRRGRAQDVREVPEPRARPGIGP
jgi:hypothetical protein